MPTTPIDAASLGLDFARLAPEIALTIAAIAVVLIDLVVRDKRILAWASAVGVVASGVMAVALWNSGATGVSFSGMVVTDTFGTFFKLMLLAATLLVVMVSPDYVQRRLPRFQGEYYGLILLATVGMMLITSLGELISIFLALEIQTFALVALTTLLKTERSTESGLKFLLLSAVATAVMLYGMALLFGMTGSTFIDEIGEGVRARVLTGGVWDNLALVMVAVMLLVGFGFKISSVPFQMWVPAVYEGAPTPIVGFLSVASKAAGFAVLLRVFIEVFGYLGLEWLNWPILIGILAIASMTLGNLVAIVQTNVIRLLAYSTIAHAGYILVGVAALQHEAFQTYELALSSVLFYLAAYTLSNMAAFGALIAISGRTGGGDRIQDLAGVAARAPFAAFVLTIALVSLVGLPPTGLFVGKIYLFYGAVQSGLWWLALAGAVNSFVSAYYYLRPIRAMYAGGAEAAEPATGDRPSLSVRASLVISVTGIVVLGVVPPWLISRASEAARSLIP